MACTTVLHPVNVELGFGPTVTRPVEAFNPAARFVEICSLGRNNQNAIDALNGQHAQSTKQGIVLSKPDRCGIVSRCRSASCGSGSGGCCGRRARPRCRTASCRCSGTADEPQCSLDFAYGSVLERKHTDRHALEQIHIKSVDDVQPAFRLRTGSSENQQIAQAIDTHQAFRRHHGPQDGSHLSCTDVLQGDDDGTRARGHGHRPCLSDTRTDTSKSLCSAYVVATPRISDQRKSIDGQSALQ